jgi:hypothetical protein
MQESEEETSSNESFVTVPPSLQTVIMSTTTASTATAPIAATAAGIPTAATTASTFTLGGKSYNPQAITNPKIILDVADEVLHKKDARINLTADDRASLFKKAVKLLHKKYEPMPLLLEDTDKLDDAYNHVDQVHQMQSLHL